MEYLQNMEPTDPKFYRVGELISTGNNRFCFDAKTWLPGQRKGCSCPAVKLDSKVEMQFIRTST